MSIFTKLNYWYKRLQVGNSPQMNLVWGFFLYTLIGFILLNLPFFHQTEVSILDNLFTATSAISTTGLMTLSLYEDYNWAGQLIVMCLFQIGGIGYMTLTVYYLLFTTSRITRWHHQMMKTEFTMPKTIRINDFIKSVIVFTLIMESIGMVCFSIAFHQTGMPLGQALWFGLFHSVSAFCTAGFSLFGDGFEGYQNNSFINAIVAVLAIAGSLGFIVITDFWYRFTGRSKSLSFTSKIVLYGFGILLAGGTALLYYTEPLVHNLGNSPLMTAFFQCMSAMTTVGFNTVPIGNLSLPILLVITFLMYVGASPSGTAGGLKITTLTAMLAVLKSRVFGQKKITFLNRVIPFERLYVATSTFILYTSLIFLFSVLMAFTESISLEAILFEVASALGTVGLSTGITGSLTAWGKIWIILLMFIGRVGVLTFGFALLERKKQEEERLPLEDDLAV